MKIKDKYKDWDGASVWEEVVKYVISHTEITTVTGISFNATFVGSCIFLKGGTPGTKGLNAGNILPERTSSQPMTRYVDGKISTPEMSSLISKDSRLHS